MIHNLVWRLDPLDLNPAVHDFDSWVAPWWRMFWCVPIRGIPGQQT